MKRKHHGMIAVLSGGVALVAIGTYAGSGVWHPSEVIRHRRPPTALNIKVPTEQQVRRMDSLYSRMGQLASPSTRSVAAKTLTLFGYQDNSASGQDADNSDRDRVGQGRWQLSLTVQTGIRNYCVIDGKFLSEGAKMADGTQVLKIENQRVLISTGQEQRWLYLDDALSPSVSDTGRAISNQREG